jgi:archaellum component FlaC
LIVEATKCDGEFRTDYSVIRQDEQLWFQQFARLEVLEQTIGNQAAYIGNVEAELRARGEHIAGLEQTIADQATHIGNVEAELNMLKSSLTWRLTAPIRQFSKSLKLKK